MTPPQVLIAGGGIGGLATALTLHQIGVPCLVFESVREMKPLGVGINLQPNAVRELYDLGITEAELDEIGVPAKEWALVGLNGNDIYSETRGRLAGYRWPQYAVHRGQLQMLLYRKVVERIGADAVRLGARVAGYRATAGRRRVRPCRVCRWRARGSSGRTARRRRRHPLSRARADASRPATDSLGRQHHVAWRDVGETDPHRRVLRGPGHAQAPHRLLSDLPPGSGDRARPDQLDRRGHLGPRRRDELAGWFRPVPIETFLHHFADWTWDWLDVPALIRGGEFAFENPMIDRDPVPTWVDGPVALLGDAAHAMYPTGSNGASQAIVDARVLGALMCDHGVDASGACCLRRAPVRTDFPSGPAQPWRGALRSAEFGRRALRRPIRQHRRCHSARRAQRVHGRLQGRGGIRDGDAERSACHHRARRTRGFFVRCPPLGGTYRQSR